LKDTYKGESPAKKFMRLHYWIRVSDELGNDRFRSGRHLVLSSREVGDVSALIGLGVPPTNIVAIDCNEGAIRQARKKFPNVRFSHCNVHKLPKKLRGKFTSAYLDFCCPITRDLMRECAKFAKLFLSDGALLGLTFLMGRERDKLFKERLADMPYAEIWGYFVEEKGVLRNYPPDEIRDLCETLSRFGAKNFLEFYCREVSGQEGLMDGVEASIRSMKRDPVCRQVWRMEAAADEAMDRAMDMGFFLTRVENWTYQSSTKKSRGVPMCCSLMTVRKPFVRRASRKKVQQWYYEHVISRLHESGEERRNHLERVDVSDVRDSALWWADRVGSHTAALLMNLSPGTLAAWKAHRTMGSYEDGVQTVEEATRSHRRLRKWVAEQSRGEWFEDVDSLSLVKTLPA
jgi:hypothetical protein